MLRGGSDLWEEFERALVVVFLTILCAGFVAGVMVGLVIPAVLRFFV